MFCRKELLTVLIVFVFLMLALGSVNNDEPASELEPREDEETVIEDTDEIEEEVESLDDLELLEHSFVDGEYYSYISGRIKNNSDNDYGYVQVQINLYDSEGTLLDSTLDNINNLRSGETWAFEAIVISPENVDSYRIESISGF